MLKKFFIKIKEMGFKSILLMNIGLLCCGIATAIFISPAKFVVGGGTGLAELLEITFDIPYYVFLYAFNILLIILSFFTLGKSFTLKTIYGSLMLPTYGMLINKICEWTKFDVNGVVTEVEPIFIVLFAALLMGVGIGLNIKNGGSTGGFDILEAIGHKYLHVSYSTVMYVLDAVLIVGGIFVYDIKIEEPPVFANGLSQGLAGAIYVFILGFIVDMITFGGFNKRAVYIRSNKYEEIHDAIIKKLARGLTYLDAVGGYTQTPTKMIVCLCYSREYFILRDMIQEIDPQAFIFVTKAEEVRGLGFNFETKEYTQTRKELQNQNKRLPK